MINVVTKRPEASRSSEAEIRAGSFGTIDGRFDTTGPLTENSKVLYRFNANWDRRDSHRDVVSGDSFFVSPVVTMLLGSRTKWDVDYQHRREENTVDVGIAAPANTFEALDRMPIETFLGEEDARATLSYNNVLSTFEHQLGTTWTFRNVVSFIDYDRAPHDVTLGALAADRRTIARTADFREQDYRSTVAEVNFLGSISTGRIRHKIAVGANYHRTVLDQQQFRSAIAPIDIFEPVYSGLPSVLPTVADSRQQVDMAGVFAQDQIELTSQFHVQTGVRLSTFEQKTLNRLTSVTQPIDVEDVSPQVGFAWLRKSWMSLYASYSESFAPNLAISADGRSFDPKTADQFEVGFKADALDGRLTSTFAAFRLTYEGNLSFVRNPVTGVFDTLQGGVQRSTGIELDVSARPAAGWTVVGSYGWLNARVITDPAYLPGRRLGGAPEHRANVWVSWESPWRIGFGGGVFYQAEFKEFTSSDFFLPSLATADAMASYRVSPRIRARVNIKNLFNERNYLSGAGGFVAYPAPPRHALASLVVSF